MYDLPVVKRGSSSPARPGTPAVTPSAAEGPSWTFLSNHAHVLLCIARTPDARIRDIALLVGITERAVQRIIADLEEAGYLSHRREGRRNIYSVDARQPLRHPIERHRSVSALIALVADTDAARRDGGRPTKPAST